MLRYYVLERHKTLGGKFMLYGEFASVYDRFMDPEIYDEWIGYVEKILDTYSSKKPKLILDLACGTGNITTRLAKKGYETIGIDLSEDMLKIATDKSEESKTDILFLQQDMRNFELYGTVDVIVCMCDSINYLLTSEDVLKVFKLVNNYLDPNGLFIFDINTPYKFEKVLSDNCFAEVDETMAYIWENYYDAEEKINEYSMHLFFKDDATGLYEKHEEIHYEKAYSIDEIKSILDESGLKFLNVYDSDNLGKIKNTSERLFFVAQEKEK